ncbi:hypothetical protein ERJ75_000832800 [Trypanosoma vivax]|uniref:Uncharacterized protein n=1 Tax=Trypanosoma vivax (strain Y486) TaxID=1055687 RepID=G0TYZ1_TRYVY|nr:hypothetical protein TRVL_00132 [Trypanosoma vivax]KAH8613054.1 hypothetical protein ERJ75_000832800 [Trypanosoma vivax]CCC49194.1 conserved hypothetical protein [Trypanosoma vivax Y486]
MEPVTEETQPTATSGAVSTEDGPGATSRKVGEAWSIDFSLPKLKRKTTRKEREALICSKLCGQFQLQESRHLSADDPGRALCVGRVADSEDNRHMQVVNVNGMEDLSSLIPRNLPTTRDDLQRRLCFRIPRLLAVAKQYPKSCGITSLTSVWNYLYSCIGENEAAAARPPVSQEEIMSILGFSPPFDAISWGPFTGNGTLIRWFHAINRHFGVRGRAYIMYKPQGKTRTSCTADEGLQRLKEALHNPCAAVVYHCHNHYMVPIGYQDIPHAQTDFYAPHVPESNSSTTIFIGEVSRGRHEALYARKWGEIVKDLMCTSPQFYNIRRPEQGIQTRAGKQTDENADSSPPPVENGLENKEALGPADHEETLGLPSTPCCSASKLSESATAVATDAEAGATVVSTGMSKAPVGCKAVKKKKRPGGNLHCLICFRCDEVEEHPERFEERSASSNSKGSESAEASASDSGAETRCPET